MGRLSYSAALRNGAAPARELLPQRRFLGLGGGQMPLFDRAEAADFFRDRRKRDRDMMIGRRQMLEDFLEQIFVVGDQPALRSALGGIAERIERACRAEP